MNEVDSVVLENVLEKLSNSDISDILRISEEYNLAKWSRDDYQIEIQREHSYIIGAKQSETNFLYGFIAARFSLSADIGGSNPSEADILNIAVYEKYQEKGIGGLLLKSFLTEAKRLKVQNVWLEVRKSNLNARRFYERNGFINVQEHKNFYTNPIETAVLMKFRLDTTAET